MSETSGDKNQDKLEDENARLRAAVVELSILNEISTAISSTLSLEEIIQLIVKKCVKHIRAEQCTVTLLDSREQENPFHTMVRQVDRSSDFLPLHLDTQIIGWILANQKPILINDMENDKHFRLRSTEDNPVKTLLSVPLLHKGNVIGSINVFNKKNAEGFTDADKRLLSIISTQSAQVIENARLVEEEKSLLHLREEMKLAFKIQTGLLPKESPRIDRYDIAGKSIPAKTVGGDYFDFIELDEKNVVICLGDVSGKGMGAALLMSNLQATFRGQNLGAHSPAEIVTKANRLLFRSTAPDKFATFFFGSLDSENNVFHYCNAGHNNPVIIHRDGGSTLLDSGGLILGALEDSQYSDARISLEPGDTILIYTDGISEARNTAEDEFGEDRLPGVVAGFSDLDASAMTDRLISEVNDFASGMPQMDDMTVVMIKRTE